MATILAGVAIVSLEQSPSAAPSNLFPNIFKSFFFFFFIVVKERYRWPLRSFFHVFMLVKVLAAVAIASLGQSPNC